MRVCHQGIVDAYMSMQPLPALQEEIQEIEGVGLGFIVILYYNGGMTLKKWLGIKKLQGLQNTLQHISELVEVV